MDSITAEKLEAIYNKIQAERNEKQKAKQSLSKERKAKLYGNSGVIISHTESGNLKAILPVGFSAVRLGSLVLKKQEAIQAFKNNTNEKLLKL